MRRYFSLLCILALLVGCYNTDEQLINEPIPSEGRIFTASFEQNSTRTYVEEGNLLRWTEGDQISLFDSNTLNQQYQFDGETGDNGGTFSKVSNSFGTGNDLNCHYAVYPYNKDIKITETGVITANLPSEQSYAENSFGLGANTMVAVTKDVDDTFLKFRNVGGYLKLQLYGENVTVKSIKLTGNNNEKIAGKVTITPAYGQSPTIVMSDDATTSITLDCGEGVKIGTTAETATAFWIVVPPTTFEKGLTITCYYGDNTTMTKSTSDSIEIARNTIVPMSTLYYDGNKPPVFELNYTTNDGQPLDPYTTDGFGANFIENIYDVATGQGALKFDARITTIPDKAFICCNNLTSITLSQDIKSIGAEAFSGCSKLAIMNIPNNVTLIGNMAFYNCSGIQEITIPSSVTSIGSSSFKGCSGKANINCYIKEVSTRDGGENGAFYRAKFTEAIIGEGVTSIGSYAFWYCTSLASITIPNSVTRIGNSAFNKCESLTSVTIPDSVTSISEFAFSSCSGMKVLTLGSKVSSIQERAFSGCSSLESVIITNNKGINMYNGAFEDCDNLESVYYNDDLINWFNMNFEYGSSNPLDNGARLYINGTELTEIDVPNGISAIKDYTFNGCTSITKVTMHNRITSVGHSTFCECFNLKEVYCMTTIPPTCGTTTFSYYKNGEFYPLGCKIYVPIGSVETYKVADGWNSYVSHIEGYEF